MADDLKNAAAHDRARINVNEAHELQYWTRELGVTEPKLRAAVVGAGTSSARVRTYLGK